jgi:pyridoxal phosphate enzyme (YggS family)
VTVAERLDAVRDRVAAAAEAAGRSPDDVTLVAVCKRQPLDRILEAHDHGQRDFGENTVQGLCDTAEAMAHEGRDVRWHFVGRLQTNKINKLLPHVGLLHTVDSAQLADALNKRSSAAGLDVLVQVNVGQERQKGGADPTEAVALARDVARREHLRLRGLMAMPPAEVEPRPYFEMLARLLGELRTTAEGSHATELSMGMTDDFESAIACGATIVRVGTAIFGERRPRA